jgi:D-3-phosphoglycerate dehydrogenase
MPRVVYFATVPPAVRDIVASQVPEGWEFLTLETGSAQEREAKFREADYILVATEKITDEMLASAPRLRLIQHQGVGYDNIDVAAATRRGIPVALTPEGTSVGVAEHTFLLILSLYKKLLRAHRSLVEGEWLVWELRPHSYEICGKQIGLIGFGRIGQEVAKRALAFEAKPVYYDVMPVPAEVERRCGASRLSLEDLLRTSDIVSLHVPRTPQTVGMIGWRELSLMKETAVLINTARGGLVDEAALYEALVERRIAGAGLDVFEKEPPSPDNPLLRLDNVVLTPHISAGTRDALITKMKFAFANMVRVHQGAPPLNRVEE